MNETYKGIDPVMIAMFKRGSYNWVTKTWRAIGMELQASTNLEIGQLFEHILFVLVRQLVVILHQPGLGLRPSFLPLRR